MAYVRNKNAKSTKSNKAKSSKSVEETKATVETTETIESTETAEIAKTGETVETAETVASKEEVKTEVSKETVPADDTNSKESEKEETKVPSVDDFTKTAIEEAKRAIAKKKEELKQAKELEESKKSEEKPTHRVAQKSFDFILNQRKLRTKGSYSKFNEELARRQGRNITPSTKGDFNEILRRRLSKKF